VKIHGFNQVIFEIKSNKAEYEAMLKGTHKNMSQLL
jgi:hypothetical protein